MISVSIDLPIITVSPLIFNEPTKVTLSKNNQNPIILIENIGFSFVYLKHKVLEITFITPIPIGQYDCLIETTTEIVFNGVVEFRNDLNELKSLQNNEKTNITIGRYTVKRV